VSRSARSAGLPYITIKTDHDLDTEFRDLAQELPDRSDYTTAKGAWMSVLCECARERCCDPFPDPDRIMRHTGIPERIFDALLNAGLMTPTGITEHAYLKWCPQPRPRYPSDERRLVQEPDGVHVAPRSSAESAEVPSYSHSPTPSGSNEEKNEVLSARARVTKRDLNTPVDPEAELPELPVVVQAVRLVAELTGRRWRAAGSKSLEMLRDDVEARGIVEVEQALRQVKNVSNGSPLDPVTLVNAAHRILYPWVDAARPAVRPIGAPKDKKGVRDAFE
jgi:hypothetical protein